MNSLSQYEEYLKANGKSVATISSYVNDARVFLKYLQERNLNLAHLSLELVHEFRTFLSQECKEKANTVRRGMIGLRQYLRFLSTQSHISEDFIELIPIPEREEKLNVRIDLSKIEDLIVATKSVTPPIKACRDEAMICLIAFEGIKATELVHLRWSNLVLSGDIGSLKIEGTRERVIELSAETCFALRAYRTEYQRFYSDFGTRPMFIAFKGRQSSVMLTQISRHGLKFAIYELGERVQLNRLNSEDLRHCAIQYQLGLGKSMDQIMQHLGLRRPGLVQHHALVSVKPLDNQLSSNPINSLT